MRSRGAFFSGLLEGSALGPGSLGEAAAALGLGSAAAGAMDAALVTAGAGGAAPLPTGEAVAAGSADCAGGEGTPVSRPLKAQASPRPTKAAPTMILPSGRGRSLATSSSARSTGDIKTVSKLPPAGASGATGMRPANPESAIVAAASGPVTGGMNPPAGAIASPDALAEIEAALLPKLAEFERRQQGRGASDPRRSAPLATLSEAQALLDPATLLVELHLGRAGAFAIVVGTSTLGAFALGPSGPIEEDARQLHRRYAARNEQPPEERAEARAERIAVADREAAALATALDQRLVGPWRGLLAGKSRVVVVPDGALHYLPFAPFFPGLAVTSLPSLTVLLAQRRASAPAGGTTLVVMGDPVFDLDDPRATEDAQRAALREAGPSRVQRLPFTRRESEAVASLVPASARRLWLDFDATKDKLGPALGRPRYLHLATHGVLDAAHPERSGLLFSRTTADGRPQDGFLSLAEIYDLELKSELVTLSACETALGAEVRGEGLIGLTRGFLHAGARAVLASLWKVNDQATERLMRAFYRGLLEQHLPPAVALARAQEALRSEERYRAPYYWAGFVLQGEFGAARPKHW